MNLRWKFFSAPYIKPCTKSNPDLDRCITDAIEDLRGKLAEGIPELEAPPIEPLKLDTVRLLRGPTGARLDINLTNIEVKATQGFRKFSEEETLRHRTF